MPDDSFKEFVLDQLSALPDLGRGRCSARMDFIPAKSRPAQVRKGRIRTLPPTLMATAERRFPIRRVSTGISTLAGPEAGAPGAVRGCARLQGCDPFLIWERACPPVELSAGKPAISLRCATMVWPDAKIV
jgi:hypothetical protein